jgi:flagellar biogenesis protein FliO
MVSSQISPTNANGEYSEMSEKLFIVLLVIAAVVVLVLAAFLLYRRMGNGPCRSKSYHINNCDNVMVGGTIHNNVDVVSRH